MAMHNVFLFAQENYELRTAIQEESSKRTRPKTKIAYKGSLTAEEAQSLIQAQVGAATEDSTQSANQDQASRPRVRAPPKCSNCGIVGHNRTKCPTKNVT